MVKFAKKPKMLVVDDVTDNIRMLIEILKDDYAIIPATSGKVALEKATASTNDLEMVLLDILMPTDCKPKTQDCFFRNMEDLCLYAFGPT